MEKFIPISIPNIHDITEIIKFADAFLSAFNSTLHHNLSEDAYEKAYKEFKDGLCGEVAQFTLCLVYQYDPKLFILQ